MDNKRTAILAFVAVVMMIAVAFVGFIVIGDDGSDATDGGTDIVSVTIGSTETTYADLSEAVEAVNTAKTGNVEFKLLDNISITSAGATTQAAIWFTYTGGTITVNGDNKTITYDAAYGSGQNVMGFASGITAIVKDLTIDGNKTTDSSKNYAYHGINIYGATSVNLENVTVKNVNAAGIIANSENVVMKNCDVSENCGWGGVNVDIGSRVGGKANLTIEGTFAGKIWTESLEVSSTVTYDGAKITMTMTTKDGNSNWKFWYSSEDLDAVVKEAVANADDEDKQAHDFVITLMDYITVSKTIDITKDMTIDLNDKNLIANDSRVIHVKTGTLTLTGKGVVWNAGTIDKDSSVIRVGQNESSSDTAGLIIGKDVYVTTGVCYGVTAFGNNKSIDVTIDGKVFVDTDREAFANNGSTKDYSAVTNLTTGPDSMLRSTQRNAIYFPGQGNLTINGTIDGKGGIEAKAGTVTIGETALVRAAGTVSHKANTNDPSTTGYALAVVNNSSYYGAVKATIRTGAVITGPVSIIDDDTVQEEKKGTIAINGGSFTDLSGIAYLVDGGIYNLSGNDSLSSDLTMGSEAQIVLGVGVTMTIPQSVVFSGKLVGPDNNTLVANGLKAGSDGITITGGSLIINGKIIKADGTYSGATVSLSGESIKIKGSLDAKATMTIEKGTIVNVQDADGSAATFTVNGTITNSGVIKVEKTSELVIEEDATLVNHGTVELKDESTVKGTIDNTKGIVGDNRTTSDTVTVTGGTVITDSTEKSKAYADEGATVIDGTVQDVKDGGTVTATNGVFVITNDATLEDYGLQIVFMQNEVILLQNAEVTFGQRVSLYCTYDTRSTISYEIETPNAMGFMAFVIAPIGYDGVNVTCDGVKLDQSDVYYYPDEGYVAFKADHNSVFTITGYMDSTGSDTDDNEVSNSNLAFIGAIVVLVVAILALAVVIKRK